ncbi:MAG: medium chain dehydrogenase/reductase family protein [Actinomycetota bacterium]|nr:medium chain dehydrogenase/reductase family protein [Actinomycetota bacterium]
MRAVVIAKHGPPEVLEVRELPAPERPLGGQVLVDVRAAGINFADTMARMGLYQEAPKPPCVVGYEVAGEVAAVGPGVEGVQPGDRVMAGTRFGGYAEQVVVKAADVIPLPERLSFEEGAAIPVNYATAWAGLFRYGGLRAGERVLIQAAAGGVGTSATQLAKRAGAEVYGTASPAKHDAIRANGVDHPIDYRQSGWERDLPRFDLVMDAIGGHSFRIGYDLLATGGRLVCFGASAVAEGERRNVFNALRTVVRMPRFGVIGQMRESKSVIGLNMLALWDAAGTLDEWIDPLRELLDDGTIRPIVAEAFPFARAAEAHRTIAERRNVGKVVLVP